MTTNLYRLPVELGEKFLFDVLSAVQVPSNNAQIAAKIVIQADKRGIQSHGCARFKSFYIDKIKNNLINPQANPEIVKDNLATAVIDGNNGLGQVTGKFAMDLAISKAKKFGLGMVAVRNSNHYGIAGYYSKMAIDAGMIGITGTNARPSVAPTFGVEPMFGTNPLAVGMPADDECDFLFDAATTIIQRGKVETFARLKKALLPGWLINSHGESPTNAVQVLQDILTNSAALLPLGGSTEEMGSHKGFGLAIMVELLSAALQNGAFLRDLSGQQGSKKVPNRIGHFFIAINISHFTELTDFKKTVGIILRELRASKRAKLANEILTAGLKEFRLEQETEQLGIVIDEEIKQELLTLRKEYGLDEYQFPF